MQFHPDQINWLAVLAAAAAGFTVGGVIYGALFGMTWAKLHGYADEATLSQMKKSQGRTFALMIVAEWLMAGVMALFLTGLEHVTWMTGVIVALFMWGGAVLPDQIMQNAAHRNRLAAFGIDTVHALLYLVAAGAILGAWR